MWKKIAIAGAVGAAVLGSGAAALAVTGTTSGTGTPATSAVSTSHARGERLRLVLRRLEHGEWITQGKTGPITHDAIGGTVAAVSPTSISVTAADGFHETFAVDSATKVRVRGAAKGTTSTISAVKAGDRVVVAGTKVGTTVTAAHVLDAGVAAK
ncbi:MAG TPA: hypothetical protein VK816_01295 [Jatrophihabitantaceae bacterium]|jgi:hypothetical protein|nr:hypothetical protein [Jatrophihabitantaceae bacterium]